MTRPGPRYTSQFTYYRWREAPKILKTKPVRTPPSGDWTVRILTCRSQALETLWAAKSLYRYVEAPLCFHDDGSLDRPCVDLLRDHFPDAQIVSRRESDERTEPRLGPACAAWRRRLIFFLRVFDFQVFADGRPYLQLDSDVLFFAEPAELLRRGPKARFNAGKRDNLSHLAWDPERIRAKTGADLYGGFNAGLLYFPHVIDFDRVEHTLNALEEPRIPWAAEQTILNIEASLAGMEPLGPEYEVWAWMRPGAVSVHYLDNSRLDMYRRGYPRLLPDLS